MTFRQRRRVCRKESLPPILRRGVKGDGKACAGMDRCLQNRSEKELATERHVPGWIVAYKTAVSRNWRRKRICRRKSLPPILRWGVKGNGDGCAGRNRCLQNYVGESRATETHVPGRDCCLQNCSEKELATETDVSEGIVAYKTAVRRNWRRKRMCLKESLPPKLRQGEKSNGKEVAIMKCCR